MFQVMFKTQQTRVEYFSFFHTLNQNLNESTNFEQK